MPQRVLCLTVLIVASLAPSVAAAADPTGPGQLDRTFGRAGVIYGSEDVAPRGIRDVAFQPNGSALVLDDDGLSRLTPSGRSDRRFGTHGRIAIELDGDGNDRLERVLVARDGGVFVIGHRRGDFLAVRRFTADGRPDARFNQGALLLVPTGTILFSMDAVLGHDGTLFIAAGTWVYGRGPHQDTRVYAIDPIGDLQSGFGHGGVVALPAPQETAVGITQLPSGQLRVLMTQRTGSLLASVEPTGALDATFGLGGVIALPPSAAWHVQSSWVDDGSLVIPVSVDGLRIARFQPSGQAAPWFSPVSLQGGWWPPEVAVGPADRVAVALTGRGSRPTGFRIGLLRSTGGLERGFGRSGWVTLPRAPKRYDDVRVGGVRFDPSGAVVVFGSMDSDGEFSREDFVHRSRGVLYRLRTRHADLSVASRARIDRRGLAAVRVRCRSSKRRCHATLRIGVHTTRFSLSRRNGTRVIRLPIHRRPRPGRQRTVTATVALRSASRHGRVLDRFRVPVRISRAGR